MRRNLSRRVFCLCPVAFAAGPAVAQSARGLDGTWGGAQNGVTAQVIVTGKTVIGFFWRNDYLDARKTVFAGDGRGLSFDFRGGTARLSLTGERTATIDVTEGGRATRLRLKKD